MQDETERVTVSTYVPAYQRELWREHAEALDMSQSEFIRTMVQAGRRGFDLEPSSNNPVEPDDQPVTPRGDDLKTDVLDLLSAAGPHEWDEIVDELNGDFEERLEEVLADLQADGRIQHSARKGGYVLLEDGDGE